MPPDLTGAQKAAVVLAQLDSERANRVLSYLTEEETVELATALAALPALDNSAVADVMDSFAREVQTPRDVAQGGLASARELLAARLGKERAREVLSGILDIEDTRKLAFLDQVDPQYLEAVLSGEHPQTIAVVVAHLGPAAGAALLTCLDPALRVDVTRRLASLGQIPIEISTLLEEQLRHAVGAVGSQLLEHQDGISTLASILNSSERSVERSVLGGLEESNRDVAEAVRSKLFLFEDFGGIDDRTLQIILRHVDVNDLAVALRTAGPEITTKMSRNLSARVAVDLEEAGALLGPVRLSQVEAAQAAIVRVAQELEANGDILLRTSNETYV